MPYDAILAAPFGALGIRTEAGALTGIDFLPREAGARAPRTAAAEQACRQLERYFADPAHSFSLVLRLRATPFRTAVWARLQAIPRGNPISYGALARELGSSARAVGQACGDNPIPVVVPCHRVVARGGLGGFMHAADAAPLAIKHWLLAHEGC
ncbi:MAG: methylated-DNA--[protein]-cysteine S-methyltransferase [Betaproteobacteria bacterium]|nr:methylated-DNA--[protein]-cysteine S-methyltransferase [Betaproteobacteria bacterium]